MDKQYQLVSEKISRLGFAIYEEQIREIEAFVNWIQEAKGGGNYSEYLDTFFDKKLYQNSNERYCPILRRKVKEMDCYETVNGCVDTDIYIHSLKNTEEVHRVCMNCLYGDII